MITLDDALESVRRLLDSAAASSPEELQHRREAFLRTIPLYPSVKHLEHGHRHRRSRKHKPNVNAPAPFAAPVSRAASSSAPLRPSTASTTISRSSSISSCSSSQLSAMYQCACPSSSCVSIDRRPRTLPTADFHLDLIEQMQRPVQALPTAWAQPRTEGLLPAEAHLLSSLQNMMASRIAPPSDALRGAPLPCTSRHLDVAYDFSDSDTDSDERAPES